MSKKSTLLQEAFLEAEELKKTAIKDAETALKESLAPKLKAILAKQLTEDLDEELSGEDEEEMDESSHESEEEKLDEKKKDEPKEEESEEEKEEDVEEGLDIDALLAEMEDDSEEMDEAKGEEETDEPKEEESEEEDLDEEIDLNAILETEEEESEEKMDEAKGEGILMSVLAPVLKKFGVSDDTIKKMTEKGREIASALQNQGVTLSEKKEKEEDVEEKSKEVDELKETLKEVNLMNIKLLYPAKIAFNHDLSKKQKQIVLESFDAVKSKKEAKLVYETLSSVLKESKKTIVTKKTLKESLGLPLSTTGESTKKVINEADDIKLKWQKRAGIIK